MPEKITFSQVLELARKLAPHTEKIKQSILESNKQRETYRVTFLGWLQFITIAAKGHQATVMSDADLRTSYDVMRQIELLFGPLLQQGDTT